MKNFYSRILNFTCSFATFAVVFAQYSNGYIVSNEGNFGTPNAEISYIDENNVVTNNIYGIANNGEKVGDVLQSLTFDQNKVYMVVNNSKKIIVADRSSFVKIGEITSNIILPRYTTVANGKIYTTNTGNSSTGKYVSVHDATTFAYIKSIPLDKSAEEIKTVNGKVYVMKSYFGGGDSFEVIDPSTDTITKTIVLSRGLQSFKVKDNTIFALCSNANGTTIYKVNTATDSVESSITNATIKNVKKMAQDGDSIYLAAGLNVYTLSTDLTTFSDTPIFSVPAGQGWDEFYGFSAIDGKIFQANANSFQYNSSVYAYTPLGTVLNTYTTTMGANGIYKNVYEATLSTNTTTLPEISVYPNPVSETLFVKNAKMASFKIYDLAGKLVKNGVYQNGIQVSTMQKGVYIIQITDGSKKITEKFIVK